MAISSMQKVEIFSHKTEKDRALSLLQTLGVVEVRDFSQMHPDKKYESFKPEESPQLETIEKRLAGIRFAIKYLAPFIPKQGFLEKISEQRLRMTPQEFRKITEKFDYQSVVDLCNSIYQKENELNLQLDRCEREKENLTDWIGLDFSLDQIGETNKSVVRTLFVSRGNYDELVARLREKTERFHIERFSQSESGDAVLLIHLKEEQEKIVGILGKIEHREVTWEGYTQIPREIIASLDKQIEEIAVQKKALNDQTAQLIDHRPKLIVIEEHLANLLERTKTESRFAETEKAVMLQGWTREEDFPALKEKMEKTFSTIRVVKVRPEKGENPPVYLENRPFAEPFEMITDLYGSPSYFELDPTPRLAPFFILFLAMCLTDAGYGLIVALLSFLTLKKIPLGQGSKRLFAILFYTGLMTIPVGAVTGGYFGLDFSNFSPQLQAIRSRLMLFDPLEGKGSIIFLGVCMGLGFIHVCFGLILAFYDSVRKGKILDGIYDQISWLALLSGLVLIGMGRPSILGTAAGSIGKWMAISAAGVIVLFGGRTSKNPVARIFAGLYSLYGITGYFGDILSYSRLMAMGMATGVIAMVINTMIGMIKGIPVIGIVLAALFFVGGHLFNILINMVSGFIHTMRLQFVEFFQKFLEGGGSPFKPLKEQYQYSLIVDHKITEG